MLTIDLELNLRQFGFLVGLIVRLTRRYLRWQRLSLVVVWWLPLGLRVGLRWIGLLLKIWLLLGIWLRVLLSHRRHVATCSRRRAHGRVTRLGHASRARWRIRHR